MSAPYDIQAVEYLGEYRLRLTFAVGLVAEVDLAAKLNGQVGPVFEALRDPTVFAAVRVDTEIGTIMWPNGCPDSRRVVVRGILGESPDID
jgi:hypothetical protein